MKPRFQKSILKWFDLEDIFAKIVKIPLVSTPNKRDRCVWDVGKKNLTIAGYGMCGDCEEKPVGVVAGLLVKVANSKHMWGKRLNSLVGREKWKKQDIPLLFFPLNTKNAKYQLRENSGGWTVELKFGFSTSYYPRNGYIYVSIPFSS